MASKPSVPGPVEGAALTANATAKPSGAPSGFSQFDEAFASALQERFGEVKSQPAPGSTAPARDPLPANSNKPANTLEAPKFQTDIAVKIAAPPALEVLPAVVVKTPPPVLQPTPKGGPLPKVGSDGEAKDDKAKKPQQASPSIGEEAVVLSYPVAMPIVPVPLSIPAVVAGNKNNPPQGSENPVPVQAVPTPQKSAAPSPSAVAGSSDAEAFSINLTPKATPIQNAASGAAADKPEPPTQPVSPTKPIAGAMAAIGPVGQKDLPKQAIQPNKAGNSPATNTPLAAPSSLKPSSEVEGEEKPREKEDAIVAKRDLSDAGGSKQEFAGLTPEPSPFSKETKSAGSASDARPVAQPLQVQDNAPTGGSAKEVAIRLQGQSGETINVKLVDQGGQVQVSVRSSDPEAASALRQDLSSLTSNLDKAGWKPEIAVGTSGNSFEPVNQTRQMDRNNQDSQGSRQPEWQQETPKRRQTVSDVWDELLTNQTA